MGRLVIGVYLTQYKLDNVGHIVMLGTPHKGSEMADYLQNNRIYKKLYGPVVQQLITRQEEFIHIFGKLDYDVGVLLQE